MGTLPYADNFVKDALYKSLMQLLVMSILYGAYPITSFHRAFRFGAGSDDFIYSAEAMGQALPAIDSTLVNMLRTSSA
jgi:hypothetical protein